LFKYSKLFNLIDLFELKISRRDAKTLRNQDSNSGNCVNNYDKPSLILILLCDFATLRENKELHIAYTEWTSV